MAHNIFNPLAGMDLHTNLTAENKGRRGIYKTGQRVRNNGALPQGRCCIGLNKCSTLGSVVVPQYTPEDECMYVPYWFN